MLLTKAESEGLLYVSIHTVYISENGREKTDDLTLAESEGLLVTRAE